MLRLREMSDSDFLIEGKCLRVQHPRNLPLIIDSEDMSVGSQSHLHAAGTTDRAFPRGLAFLLGIKVNSQT